MSPIVLIMCHSLLFLEDEFNLIHYIIIHSSSDYKLFISKILYAFCKEIQTGYKILKWEVKPLFSCKPAYYFL